jgi:hypothetical protein
MHTMRLTVAPANTLHRLNAQFSFTVALHCRRAVRHARENARDDVTHALSQVCNKPGHAPCRVTWAWQGSAGAPSPPLPLQPLLQLLLQMAGERATVREVASLTLQSASQVG